MQPRTPSCVVAVAAIAASLILAACAPPQQAEQPTGDPTKEPSYAATAGQLASLNRQAEDLLKRGRQNEAAAAIAKGQPLEAKLLAPPHPTLGAMQVVSDRDDLYARMLLANRHYVWARTFYEKNVTRWQTWRPQTPDTLRRLRQAREGVAACDRRMGH